MINIEHVYFSYHGDREILKDVNLEIKDGESVGIIGANGVGKSTLLKLLVGIEYVNGGKIEVEHTSVCKKNLTQIRKQIGYVFQDSDAQLFMPTVLEDVEFAPLNFGYSKEDARKLAIGTLESLNIPHLRPTVGLDPKNRKIFIDTLNTLNCTKIVASHDLDFILDTCTKCVLVSQGQIKAVDATRNILTNQQLLEENGLLLPLSIQR